MEHPVRKKDKVKYYSDDFEPSSESEEAADDSDYTEIEEYARKKHKRGNKEDDGYRTKNKRPKKRKNFNGTISTTFIPKAFEEYGPEDLKHDPAGQPCRFIPHEQIKDEILYLEKFLQPDERGILTFLPNFSPEETNHLEYFGFKPKLVQTDLKDIQGMSDAKLEKYLAELDAELERLPDTKVPNVVGIPGFSTNLENSVAINADIRYFDFQKLGSIQKFDVILMDPPWLIAVANVTRGVSISYDQLETNVIERMPLHYIQSDGYIFMWVIACQFANGISMFRKWGYEFVTYINWVKTSKYGRYMPSHGYYMQHNKETLLVGKKGKDFPEINKSEFNSLIINPRGIRQSHKPEKLYDVIERMFPGGSYIEIFARPHNLRNGWVSLGIELPT